jgi:hypothetical protein
MSLFVCLPEGIAPFLKVDAGHLSDNVRYGSLTILVKAPLEEFLNGMLL